MVRPDAAVADTALVQQPRSRQRRCAGRHRIPRTTAHGETTDPATVLGEWALLIVFSHLEARDLARCAGVSRRWCGLAATEKLWEPLWEEASHGKFILPQVHAEAAISKFSAFRTAQQDAKRLTITQEELCAIVWDFIFKPDAGDWWTDNDPYWNGAEPMRRVFNNDYSCAFLGPVPPMFAEEVQQWDFRWEFTRSRHGRRGQFVRVRVVGLPPWPSMLVTRREDWGWMLENEWVTYQSRSLRQ